MGVSTAATAEVRWAGRKIAKVRDISIDITRAELPTSVLGQHDETAAKGLRSTTGTGTLLYDQTDPATVAIMDAILEDDTEDTGELELFLDVATGRRISGPALLRSVRLGVSVGDLIVVPIAFRINSKPAATF
jgi:hypothetical protein